MAWYNTGNIALTNGSATVTGSGTNFLVGAQIGEALYAPDGKLYEIQTINSATVITLASNYLGSTASGQNYQIIPTQSLVADLASDVTDLISDFADVRDYAGNGKFNDGAVGTPGITFTQDQDNGLYRIGSNNWALAAGGIKQVDLSATDVEINYAGVKKLATTATGIDVTGTGTFSGEITANGGIALGDSDQATFGAGDDLRISHDGTHSKIQEVGTGDLKIQASNLLLEAEDGTNYIYAVDNSSVRLYHPDATNGIKLTTTSTGIDVTGTVTADGLTVDGNAVIDGGATDNTVLTLDSGTANTYLKMTDSNSTNGTFIGATTDDLSLYPNNTLSAKFSAGGDISFYEDTGTTPKLVWDASAESLGIGTSPSSKLDINISTNARGYFTDNIGEVTSGTFCLQVVDSTNAVLKPLGFRAEDIRFATGSTERMRIDSSGGVNIGGGGFSQAGYGLLGLNGGNGGFVKMGTAGTVQGEVYANSGGLTFQTPATYPITWYPAGALAMTLDTSGNLLVGTTSTINSGLGVFSKANSNQLVINSSNSNGGSLDFCNGGASASARIGGLTSGTATALQVQVGGSGGAQLASGATSWTSMSDERLKDIIEPISDAVSKLLTLRTVIGKYKVDAPQVRRVFVIAQDVEKVLPEAVSKSTVSLDDPEEFLGVAYSELIPLLIAGFKEQQATIEALTARIAALES